MNSQFLTIQMYRLQLFFTISYLPIIYNYNNFSSCIKECVKECGSIENLKNGAACVNRRKISRSCLKGICKKSNSLMT